MSARILLVLFACAFISCSTSPTGRKQLTLLPDRQVNDLGRQAFEEIKGKTSIDHDPAVNAYVRCVADAILAVASSKIAPSDWEIVVFNDDSANAFALASGKIGVHTGILKVAVNQDQLATVLGHEVGHVTAKHSNERVSQALLAQGGMELANIVLAERSDRDLIMGALGLGTQFGVLYPHSRKQESEADHIGLLLMAKAGFRPSESVALWENMSRASSGKMPEFLSTHPSEVNRIRQLKSLLPKAQELSAAAQRAGHHPQCRMN